MPGSIPSISKGLATQDYDKSGIAD